MAISDKIRSIETHLRADYKSLEKLGETATNKNIENIAGLVDSIYNKFPKTSYAEGSNITLSNTLKGKLDFEDGIVGYGQTSQEGTPTPETPIEVEVVKGNIEIEERGKNELQLNNKSATSNGLSVKSNNGKITISGTTTTYAAVDIPLTKDITLDGVYNFYVKFNGEKSNVDTFQVLFRRANNTNIYPYALQQNDYFINRLENNVNNDTIHYIRIYIGATATINGELDIMITKSDTVDSNYEPYKEPKTYQLSLGEYEFARIGNYRDTIEYDVENDKVYKNKAINKVILNTLTWENGYVGTNTYGTQSLLNNIGNVTTDINIICSHAVGITFNDRNRFTNTTIYTETNGFVDFRNTAFTSLEEFTIFLSNNNVYAYYVLATPTKEEITGTLKDQIKALYNSQSFNGTTIITSNGELPLVLKVRALKGE